MIRIFVLCALLFSCNPTEKESAYHLKKFVEVELKTGSMKDINDLPFQTWQFKGDSLIIDGKAKTYKKSQYNIQIFGTDLEDEYSIKSWKSDEIMLSKMTYDGKEYLLLFKR